MFFVCDHRAIRLYGLGIVKPFPFPFGFWLRSGYLLRGNTLRELAERAGIDAPALERTVTQFNDAARLGEDPVFQRGSTVYNHFQGDANHKPNPCLAPLTSAPYYAVRILPGDIGTFAGLITDAHARVLGHDDAPVPGLYAAGNDMASVMGGNYPGGGITLGPAMVFGYVAAMHMASSGE